MSTATSHAPPSDWPLLKDRWLDAVTCTGGNSNSSGGHRTDPVFELRDEARTVLREQGAAAQASQYFEVHLAHG
ncbi:MAG: hypothetical protein SFV19_08650 [Rhodospirillaceae bacterium]|nr:hypothetical protein [Rhodospirillaceae bacterium]